jgi:hypothetical protein
VTDELTFAYVGRIPLGTQLRARADRAWSSDIDDSRTHVITSIAVAEVEHGLGPGMTLGARLTLRRQEQREIASGSEALLIVRYLRNAR